MTDAEFWEDLVNTAIWYCKGQILKDDSVPGWMSGPLYTWRAYFEYLPGDTTLPSKTYLRFKDERYKIPEGFKIADFYLTFSNPIQMHSREDAISLLKLFTAKISAACQDTNGLILRGRRKEAEKEARIT